MLGRRGGRCGQAQVLRGEGPKWNWRIEDKLVSQPLPYSPKHGLLDKAEEGTAPEAGDLSAVLTPSSLQRSLGKVTFLSGSDFLI